MRENRTYGSEGRELGKPSFLTPITFAGGEATGMVDSLKEGPQGRYN